MFYDRYIELCAQRGVTPSRAALEAGLSKSTITKWKQEPDTRPTAGVIGKLTVYFGISEAELLQDTGSCIPAYRPEFTPSELIELPPEGTFYERFIHFCALRHVSPSRAAVDSGLSKSTVTKWKHDPAAQPNGIVLGKLSEYFNVPVAALLGEELPAERVVDDEAIKFALFGGSEDITDEMYEEVRNFATFIKQREASKRRKD